MWWYYDGRKFFFTCFCLLCRNDAYFPIQGLKKDFEDAGFKIGIKQLVDFQDVYGLDGDENADEESGSENGDDDLEIESIMEK